MSELKADISQNEYGLYQIAITEVHGRGYVPSPRGSDTAYTLNGARKKAVKMLAKLRRADEYPIHIEEVR